MYARHQREQTRNASREGKASEKDDRLAGSLGNTEALSRELSQVLLRHVLRQVIP